MAKRPLAVDALLEQAALDQAVQPPRQNVGRDVEALLKLVEPRQALEGVPQQQDAPPFADSVEAARDGARPCFEACSATMTEVSFKMKVSLAKLVALCK